MLRKDFGGGTIEKIQNFESKMGYRFPLDYLEFLKNNNGGFPQKKVFLINDAQGQDSLSVFFGVDLANNYISIDYLYENFGDRFPNGVIPIGEDPGGNYVCINLSDESYGRIYFYDNEIENENDDGKLTWDNLYLIAASFTEFLEKLH